MLYMGSPMCKLPGGTHVFVFIYLVSSHPEVEDSSGTLEAVSQFSDHIFLELSVVTLLFGDVLCRDTHICNGSDGRETSKVGSVKTSIFLLLFFLIKTLLRVVIILSK